jgi:hypothetical protein
LSDELSECNTLDAHFKDLYSQYAADIRRAEMIVDGEVHRHGIEENETCPYCENKMPPRKVQSHVASIKGSIEITRGLLDDLLIAQQDLNAKRDDILNKIRTLENERNGVDDLINGQLRPKAETLKRLLKDYRFAIEIRKETAVIGVLENDLKAAIFAKMSEEDETDAGFSIKKHFDGEFFRAMDEYVNRLLIATEYLNMDTAYVGHSDFDLWVNGQAKRVHGKGFRAFQNTIMALTLLEFLSENGKYSPSMLIVDSPIQSLEESVDNMTPDTMKTGLFKYLLEHQSNGQVIVIENRIPPDLDYESANMVEFTKGKKSGRYGLLNGIES